MSCSTNYKYVIIKLYAVSAVRAIILNNVVDVVSTKFIQSIGSLLDLLVILTKTE